MHASNSIIKFADDTTVVGLMTNNDETAYREEVMIVDFRIQQREHPLFTSTGQQWRSWKVV